MTRDLVVPPAVDAEVVHFFSWSTGVSIELPIGFEEVADEPGALTLADVDDDDPDAPAPVLRVQVAALLPPATTDEERTEALADLVAGFLATGEVVSRTARTVDGDPAETVVTRADDGLLLHQTGVAASSRLLAVVGTTLHDDLLGALEVAVDSVRLVEA